MLLLDASEKLQAALFLDEDGVLVVRDCTSEQLHEYAKALLQDQLMQEEQARRRARL